MKAIQHDIVNIPINLLQLCIFTFFRSKEIEVKQYETYKGYEVTQLRVSR